MLSASRLLSVVIITILGLFLAYAFDFPLSLGFVAGLIGLIWFSLQQGVSGRQLMKAMWEGAKHTQEVMWILALVGIMIPVWTASGTIPFLIDSGLSLLNPAYYVTFAFLFSAAISMILGTSTGTLSSVGIPLMGMAGYLQIPLGLAAGALVSGAFVGDRTSPFSSAHRLVASSTGMTVKAQFKFMLPTSGLALTACLFLFGLSDYWGNWGAEQAVIQSSAYHESFHFSQALWLPMILLVGSILIRLPIKYGFLLSTFAAVVLGTILQDMVWSDWPVTLWSGYASSEMPSLQTKGLESMVDLVLLIALAGAFNGILEETKMIEPYMEKLLGHAGSMFSATWRTSLFGLGLAVLSCTQTLPIMMTGRNLLPLWERRFPRGHLSRVVADAPLVMAPMIPWNLITILCTTILGISWETFIAYAVFLWSLPLFTLLVSWFTDRKHNFSQENHKAVQKVHY